MKKFTGALALGAACIIGGTVGATAADLYGGSLKDGGYMPAIAASPTWYLRLDGGFAGHDKPVMVEDGMSDLLSPKIGTTWTLGGGIGRYFTNTVRGDITYDHRFDADVSARWEQPTYVGIRRFGLSSDVVLANLYYDFDRGSRFSPYVGVGLGTVYHQVEKGKVDGTCACATIAEDGSWHVAGAVMAGFTVALRDRLHLDAGYRFLYLGETKAGGISNNTPAAPAIGPTIEDIHAHELRVGLRYDIR